MQCTATFQMLIAEAYIKVYFIEYSFNAITTWYAECVGNTTKENSCIFSLNWMC